MRNMDYRFIFGITGSFSLLEEKLQSSPTQQYINYIHQVFALTGDILGFKGDMDSQLTKHNLS